MARGRGRGWGRRGTAPRPATGRRRAHFHRGGAPRPAPGRPGRPGGEGGSGGAARLRARRTTSPRVLQPSGRSFRRIPGPRKPDTRRRALPLPPSASRAGVGVGAGPPLPRRDRSPTPLRRLSRGPVGGGADCPQCAPGVVAPSGPGGTVGHASPDEAERTGSAAMSAISCSSSPRAWWAAVLPLLHPLATVREEWKERSQRASARESCPDVW